MRWPALVLVLAAACSRTGPVPAPPPASAPVWPAGLTEGWTAVELKTQTGAVRAERDGGGWRLAAPRRGDADPDTIDRLKGALTAPQVLASRPIPAGALVFDREVSLETASGQRWHLGVRSAVLGAPVVVTIDRVGQFTVSPVELANKVPNPEELLTPGLWVAADRKARKLTVTGPRSYVLEGQGEDWTVVDGGLARRDVDNAPGTITGRQAIGHPAAPLAALGLEPPLATARLCTADTCRDFRFGKVETDAGTRYYAVAPESDPLELRASDWHQVVDGPF